jgi:hypothetical protein
VWPSLTAPDEEHQCALAEVPEHDAVTVLVAIMRRTSSASEVVAALARQRLTLARRK